MNSALFRKQAQLLRVLAQPKRLEIIHLLREGQLRVTEIYSMLDLTQANVSQHLMVLRRAGVVKTKREGKKIYYSLTDDHIIRASDTVREWLLAKHSPVKTSDEQAATVGDLLQFVTDPVCGMRIAPRTAAFSTQHQGQDYYFCASGCYKQFSKRPTKYAQ